MLAPGAHVHSVVELVDLFPTLAELSQVAPPGLTLKQHLQGKGRARREQHQNRFAAKEEPLLRTSSDLDQHHRRTTAVKPELAGEYIPLPDGLDGQSLAGLVLGDPSNEGGQQLQHERLLLGVHGKNVAIAQWFGLPQHPDKLLRTCVTYTVRVELNTLLIISFLVFSKNTEIYLNVCDNTDILHFFQVIGQRFKLLRWVAHPVQAYCPDYLRASAELHVFSHVRPERHGNRSASISAIPFDLEESENIAPRAMAGGVHPRKGAPNFILDVLNTAALIEEWAERGAREVVQRHESEYNLKKPKQPPKKLIKGVLDGVCCVEFFGPLAKAGIGVTRHKNMEVC